MATINGTDNDDVLNGTNQGDTITGKGGNDVINASDGDDTVYGDNGPSGGPGVPGNDVIDGGNGNDRLFGEAGNDIIQGGEGSDRIEGGTGNDTIDGGGSQDVISGGDGDDTIQGGAGDDSITGDDGDDRIDGGSGQDKIDGGTGDDTIQGGQGDDRILGGNGNDEIEGGQGQDRIDGGVGDDTIAGGEGDDQIEGGDGDDRISGDTGNDTLTGGTGNDQIDGGTGNDRISGGDGDDQITGGAGQDQMRGGDGADRFIVASAADGQGDRIDGGTGGDDRDVLDLSSAGDFRLLNLSIDADGDSQSGRVEFLDANGNITGRLEFSEIESIIPCFTSGTRIATPRGEIAIEDLKEGERVITRDNGMQEIRWIGQKPISHDQLQRLPHLRPILLRAGALGRGLPAADLLLSPNHRVLLMENKAEILFEEPEVLSAAKHLTDRDGIDVVMAAQVTYWHILFDNHEVILSNGAWTESFQPGDYSLKGIGVEQRREVLDLFPQLTSRDGVQAFETARMTLKKYEAKLLAS